MNLSNLTIFSVLISADDWCTDFLLLKFRGIYFWLVVNYEWEERLEVKTFCLLASLQKVKFWSAIHPRFNPLAYFQENGTSVNISSIPASASIVSRDCSSPWTFSIGTGTSRPVHDIFFQFWLVISHNF